MKPFTMEDCDNLAVDRALSFFEQAFKEPADFFLICVGDFGGMDIHDELIPLVSKYLGSLPISKTVAQHRSELVS
jgi:hypothetical protein